MTPPRTPSAPRRAATLLCLTFVLVLGGWLRISGLNWDEGQHLHPDERYLTMVVSAQRWPGSLTEYFDETRSPLNPRNAGFRYFAYGTLPTTIVKAASLVSGHPGYDDVQLVGRAISAALDLGTIVLLFLFARRVHGCDTVALLAAFLLAVAVLPIQHAHFFVVDPFAVFFIAAALVAVSRMARGSTWPYVAAGTSFALALACKVSALPFALVIVVGAVHAEGLRRWRPIALRLVLAGISTLLVFRVAEPYAFTTGWLWLAPSPRWLGDLVYTHHLMTGAADIPPGIQWASRTPFVFQIENLARWNLGPVLGVAACLGFSAAVWQLLVRRKTVNLIPVVWIVLVFGPNITQFVKAGRYLLPMYPMLVLLAAWALAQLWAQAGVAAQHASLRRVAAAVVIATVCVGTLLWAIAFTSIYRRPNTRVVASRWIYSHIPAQSVLATELWDDRLPLRLGGDTPERYAPIEMSNYDDDSPDKLAALIRKIDGADYIILASNRLYDSIPRLPMRYPVTSRYYSALFDGRLGFERVAEFTSYPQLGPLAFPDQTAEEAFSVYDHARVQIFKRTVRWNVGAAERLLTEGVDWSAVVAVPAAGASFFNNGQLLAPGDWERIRSRDAPLPARDSTGSSVVTIAVWCLALQLLGLAALPITSAVFRQRPDRGWLLSRLVGVLVVAYLAWLGASLHWWTFNRAAVVTLAALPIAFALWWAWRARSGRGVDHVDVNWRLVCAEEMIFWAVFALFLLVRAGNPDLWHPAFGGEKPMDFAYLNAVVRTGTFPPYDPWFAGGYINYYYFGFVLVGALIALTGVAPAIAYNLAIPTLAALTATAAFTVAHSIADAATGLTRRRLAFMGGLFAIVAITLIGNLGELGPVASSWNDPTASHWPRSVWYWNATRVIPTLNAEAPPITEFPYFSFLYGDLHPHVIALPLTLLALAIAVTFVLPVKDGVQPSSRLLPLSLLALTLGALYATNTWDYPTYLFVGAAAIVLDEWRMGRSLGATAARIIFVVVAGRVFFAPFFAHYAQPYGSVEPWRGSHTPLAPYLTVHGLFLFVLISLWTYRWLVRGGTTTGWARLPLQLLALLSALGLALSLAVEVVVLGGDIDRMNTVFKVYFQVWTLWGVTAAVGAALLLGDLRAFTVARQDRGPRLLATAWLGAAAILVAMSALYPLLATRARWQDRFDVATGFTLDGQAYMTTARHIERDTTFALAYDLEAIRWLEGGVRGTPVIAEGHTLQYRWGGRISANTGLPTILGWSWHQTQQRAALPSAAIERRAADVDALYSDADVTRPSAILDRYHVDYVYVGDLERILYPAAGLEKFSRHPDRFVPVHRNERVTIYRVVR